eukprot:TRINITY_DN19454_c0_g1_i1.p1 TRINITY_DN19454_c0_g1~~TRINITY_DN19454_c0_g1_i1.p1  ORF type:complete len:834 (+),score=235.39 TRINITY_DN19454_c0_g1_i1:41-2503(+)
MEGAVATRRSAAGRSADEIFMRREFEALEEKVTRQMLRLQEQSERFVDVMMRPLESKVAALEGRQPAVDCSLAEVRGNLKGLQDSVEMQGKRAEQAESQLRHWRKCMEDDLNAKYVDLSRKSREGHSGRAAGRAVGVGSSAARLPAAQDLVTQAEFLDVVQSLKQSLKQEVKRLVDEMPASQVGSVAPTRPKEQSATADTACPSPETKTLVAVPRKEEASLSLALAKEVACQSVEGLEERLLRSERLLEEARLDVRQLQSDLRSSQVSTQAATTALQLELKSSQNLHDGLQAASAAWEQAIASLAGRLQSLEEQERQSRAELLEQVRQQSSCQAQSAELAGRLQALEMASVAWPELSEVSGEALRAVVGRLQSLEEHERQCRAELLEQVRQQSSCQAQSAELAGRLQALETPSVARPEVPEVSSETMKAVVGRLQSLEEHERHCQVELLEQVRQSSSCQAQSAELAGRLQALEVASIARLEALEVSSEALQAVTGREPARGLGELSEGNAEGIVDSQLMLLDLQRRVSALEDLDTSPLRAAEAPSPAAISKAAQLAESLALNLNLARRAVGLAPANSRPQSPRSEVEDLQPAAVEELSVRLPVAQLPVLPPVAAMKVGLSPRLQQLSISPRLPPEAPLPSVSKSLPDEVAVVCTELRAEVAAVWDAVAELADLFGNFEEQQGCSGMDGKGSAVDEALQSQVDNCKRSMGKLNHDVQRLKGEVEQLGGRVQNCEQRHETASPKRDPDRFPTFDGCGDDMFNSSVTLALPSTLMSPTKGRQEEDVDDEKQKLDSAAKIRAQIQISKAAQGRLETEITKAVAY